MEPPLRDKLLFRIKAIAEIRGPLLRLRNPRREIVERVALGFLRQADAIANDDVLDAEVLERSGQRGGAFVNMASIPTVLN